jgi:ubiquinone/menaquinone biosynthesis C-methylase UbiE
MEHWTENLWVNNPELFTDQLEARAEAAPTEVEKILTLLSEEYDLTPESVLDVGCGIGRHVVAFADAGVAATGLDISSDYLAQAEDRATEADVTGSTTFIEGDMRDLKNRTDNYDLVTSIFSSFGYYNDKTNEEVLAGMYDRLSDGGVLLLELANKEGVLSDFDTDGVFPLDSQVYVETREYDPTDSRMQSTFRVLDDDSEEYRGKFSFEVRMYAPIELKQMFMRAGFENIRLYASFDRTDLSFDSQRLVVVGQKSQ